MGFGGIGVALSDGVFDDVDLVLDCVVDASGGECFECGGDEGGLGWVLHLSSAEG